ncbi:restriction endonuclease subunit M [Psittacicella melopsittaci]|uniref:site-specific DNA-methyltransferase (adenine-specific) n=1 Tax=Psittacicella melopsittaci TaxID=2028576 RepID=A0A3A1Y7E0_9GAMM|nr:N-6 DNA methylase [Psittacicella melopsittaci]RIY33431.1 restriction endonuclease subunit M [Psittacicella melopsittaci]
MKNTKTSVEPEIAFLVIRALEKYGLDFKLEQAPLNTEIDNALKEYESKSGGKGGNRPDVKLILKERNLKDWPVLIEYKGYKDRLEKLDANGQVDNRKANNISSYAVNGAVHYANALLHYTGYTDVIAIGVTGYRDSLGKLCIQLGAYYVSKDNFGVGQKIIESSGYDFEVDLLFLKQEYFDEFVNNIYSLKLTAEEKEQLKEKREKEIEASLVKLNNDIYQNEKGLGESDRVYLVAASIIATLGIPNEVSPLSKDELKSKTEKEETDGKIISRKIRSFLDKKNIPESKKNLITSTLESTLLSENINTPVNGESQLKRVFCKIVDDLGIYYKIGLNTDFTGKLFNEMYSWLGFTQDKLNDVVLTPSYVATLLVKLARVNKDSYVWDFATGSAGLLVAAMNEMLEDAKREIKSPEALKIKECEIKAEQLLGIELLPSVYMLAVLNMIMMGDGSSNIINEDSLQFDGKYGFGKDNENFLADAFVLNPPYSAEGGGMIFVEQALKKMKRGGYAAVIIQNSAGSGKAKKINKRILKNNTLEASIKMPVDLFIGKSNIQTYIYVFNVGFPHKNEKYVKFIDFSDDGYTRSNRRKSNSNLKDTGNAKEKYQEVIDIVVNNKAKEELKFLPASAVHIDKIDVNSGEDWNKSAPMDLKPSLEDFKKTIADYLSWEVTNLLNNASLDEQKQGK